MPADDSETDDSDFESSAIVWLDLSSSIPDSSAPDNTSTRSFGEKVVLAMQALKDIRLADIVADAQELQREILVASNTINNFLDGIMLQNKDSLENLGLFASLVRPGFLSTMFAQRRIFHTMAMKALDTRSVASTVVCWVDGMIAKLAEATIVVACGSSSHSTIPPPMKVQLEDDGIRAAAQLPEKWSMVPSVISSAYTSPAAKRLAIQLAFAVYIVGPRLQESDPWIDCDTSKAVELSKILNDYILSIPINEHAPLYTTQALVDQLRLTYGMVLCLFAVSDHNIGSAPPFRPRTLCGMLYMIQLILSPNLSQEDDSACITPCEQLNPAQILLLHWGDFVAWCWKTWTDYRVANTEWITRLTATWLYHFRSRESDPVPYQEISDAYILLDRNGPVANYAIRQISHHSMVKLLAAGQTAALPESFYVVLFNACRSINHLFLHELVRGRKMADTETTTRCLLGLFMLLCVKTASDGRLELRAIIIESLTMIDEDAVEKAIADICKDEKIRFVERIEEVILQSRRELIRSTEPGQQLSNAQLEELRIVIYFLIRLWHSAEARTHVHRQPILNLLASLTNRLSKGELNSIPVFDCLREAVVIGFCVLDTDPNSSIKSPRQEDVWRLALDAGCSDLVMTSNLTHHIIVTARLPDPLTCAETWDHLRDTMTLIFRRHFMDEEETTALVVSLGICGAMIRLLDADATTVHFILTSPWTMSFCAELKRILHTEPEKSRHEYFLMLKDQLAPIGDVLLNVLRFKLDADETSPMKANKPTFRTRMVYHGRYPDYRLLLVSRILQ
ncbi:hypothetical protein EV361DRAFT_884428 [Lentinula raphanica]|nr:hypothetical protein EV361DRAFT_884428 [Lentinula raphanica]